MCWVLGEFLSKETTQDAMYYFMSEIENPQMNNTEERWAYATAIEIWYSELESRQVIKYENRKQNKNGNFISHIDCFFDWMLGIRGADGIKTKQ